MNQSHASPPALPESEAVSQSEVGRPSVAGPRSASPSQPTVATRPGWSAGRIASLVIGGLLALLSLALLGGGGTLLWADRTQRDAGYVTSDVHDFVTAGSALATVETDLGSAGVGWLYAPALLDTVRIRVTPVSPGRRLFVGIGPSSDVDRYLAGVSHTVISEFFDDETRTVAGGMPASPPGAQAFWVASASGAGVQTVTWDPSDGAWTVVVMNADGRPGIDIRADLGATVPALPWIAVGLLSVGAILLVGGALLIVNVIRGRHARRV